MKYNETRENCLGLGGGGGGIHQGQFRRGEFDQVGIHWGAFHIKCVRWKILEQIGIGVAYLDVFLIAMRRIDTAAGVSVELKQICLSFFCKNS